MPAADHDTSSANADAAQAAFAQGLAFHEKGMLTEAWERYRRAL